MCAIILHFFPLSSSLSASGPPFASMQTHLMLSYRSLTFYLFFFIFFFFFLFFRLCTFDCSIFRWRFIYFFSAISNLPLSPSRKYFISDCFYFFTLDFAFGIFVEFILFIDITFMLKHFRVFYNSLKIVSFDYLNLGVIAVLKSATSISRPIGENFYHLVLFLSMVHILLFLYMSLFFSFLLETEPFYNILQHLGILIFF